MANRPPGPVTIAPIRGFPAAEAGSQGLGAHPASGDDLAGVMGHVAVDIAGHKIGRVGKVYIDDVTGEARWIAVSTGLFGTKEILAPLAGAQVQDDNLRLAVSKELVKTAPEFDGDVGGDYADRLLEHYDVRLEGLAGGTEAVEVERVWPVESVKETAKEAATDHGEWRTTNRDA